MKGLGGKGGQKRKGKNAPRREAGRTRSEPWQEIGFKTNKKQKGLEREQGGEWGVLEGAALWLQDGKKNLRRQELGVS